MRDVRGQSGGGEGVFVNSQVDGNHLGELVLKHAYARAAAHALVRNAVHLPPCREGVLQPRPRGLDGGWHVSGGGGKAESFDDCGFVGHLLSRQSQSPVAEPGCTEEIF